MKRSPLNKISDKKAEEMKTNKNKYGWNSTLKRRSKKQAKIEAEHSKIKQQMLEDGKICEVQRLKNCGVNMVAPFDSGCDGVLDLDEVLSRGRGGRADDETNVILLCRKHHSFKHEYPVEAELLGLSKKGK